MNKNPLCLRTLTPVLLLAVSLSILGCSKSNIKIEDNKESALRAIDQLAAHPEDPNNPKGVKGLTDKELEKIDVEKIVELITIGQPYAVQEEAENDDPRYLFALGRAALIHGDLELAEELLEAATTLDGSPAADAYLAQITDDIHRAAALLEKAVEGGFKPAKAWLKEVNKAIEAENKKAKNFRFDKFNNPELIRDLFFQNMNGLAKNEANNILYVASMHNALSDKSVLFMTDNREILLEVDPAVSLRATQKLTSSSSSMRQLNKAGQQSMWGPIMAVVNARKSGATVDGEVQAMMNAVSNSPAAKLRMMREQAAQDASRLVLSYDSNPEGFRKVYAGMKRFIMS